MRWKFAAASLLLVTCPAFAKSLYWRSLDVNARLDSDGRLHVLERQAMVFDGDWNGGERRFNIRRGQSLQFNGIRRIEDGRAVDLRRGNLSEVDHWNFTGPGVVRWRSRRPSDPPFQNRELVYVLDYVLSGILEQTSGGARLQHDFAFPDRAGRIENYSLHFELDPVWRGIQSPLEIRRRDLPPGQSTFVVADLTYAGAGRPAAVHVSPPHSQLLFFPVLIVLAGILLTAYFYSAEAQKGRFAPLFPTVLIDERWLQRYVFSLPPEAVGGAWDEVIGAPEVAAVIARMAQEKKLTTWVTQESGLLSHPSVLHLRLNVDWNTLPEGEQNLIRALFLGKTETDTKTIAAHYEGTGFDPAKLIREWIDGMLAKVPEWTKPERVFVMPEIALAAFVFLCGWIAVRNNPGTFDVRVIVLGVLGLIGLLVAVQLRKSAERVIAGVSPIFAWLVLGLAAVVCYDAALGELPFFFIIPIALGAMALATLLLLLSRSRDSVTKLAFRRRLAAARAYFQSQLRAPHPPLRDEWYPYLVALGLGAAVDRWFRSFGEPSTATSSNSSGGSTASSGGSSASWTGGGGAFGGAGASGSWAAMSALAGGVASPGSGGGGGGGGGGSGGGGGGGW